jgi:hypothetical protein
MMDSGPWRRLEFDKRALDAVDTLHLAIAEPTLTDGYDPYESVPNLATRNGMRKHKDLRRLSEWIRARRQAEGATREKPEATGLRALLGRR